MKPGEVSDWLTTQWERRQTMTTQPALDQAKMEAFVHKVLGDTSATLTTTLAAIGDRLGLFQALATHGPATSVELATRTGINERYAREWLGGMASAGYLKASSTIWRFFRISRKGSKRMISPPFKKKFIMFFGCSKSFSLFRKTFPNYRTMILTKENRSSIVV
jgi:hypothetical protein